MKRFALVLVSTGVTLLAQASSANSRSTPGGFSVPMLGFVASQSPAQLRPILGIPGSARLGKPVLLPTSVTQIHLAPGQAFALVEQASSNPLSIVSLEGVYLEPRTLALTPIPGAMSQIDLFAFSPMGGSAVIYSRQTSHLQVLTGLPKSPQVTLNLSNLVTSASPQKLAVSDDGQSVLLLDESGAVYSVNQGAAPAAVHHSPNVSALEFVAQSRDAIICDRSLNTASLVHGSGISPVVLAPTAAGLCQAEAAVSTVDGKMILLACPAQHAILSLNRASGLTRVYNIADSPVSLDRLSARDVFLMSPPQGDTYWLLVWGPGGPVRSFVAGARDETEGSKN